MPKYTVAPLPRFLLNSPLKQAEPERHPYFDCDVPVCHVERALDVGAYGTERELQGVASPCMSHVRDVPTEPLQEPWQLPFDGVPGLLLGGAVVR